MDCITHGKYGFTDSNGDKREYSYSSGVRCDPDSKKVRVQTGALMDIDRDICRLPTLIQTQLGTDFMTTLRISL